MFSPTSISGLNLWLDAEKALAFPPRLKSNWNSGDYVTGPLEGGTNLSGRDWWVVMWFETGSSLFGGGTQYLFNIQDATYSTEELAYLSLTASSIYVDWYSGADFSSVEQSFTPATNTRYMFMGYWNNTTKTIGVTRNNTAFDTSTDAGLSSIPIIDGYVSVGSDPGNISAGGKIGYVAFGSPASGTMTGAVATTIRDRMYASGWGIPYEDLTSSEKTDWGLKLFYHMDEPSGSFLDRHGANHLTTITGTYNRAVADYITTNNTPVYKLEDQSGQGNHFTQPAYEKRPLYKTGMSTTGKPGIQIDGVDDYLEAATAFTLDWTAGHILARLKVLDDPPPGPLYIGLLWDFGLNDTEANYPYTDGKIYASFLSTGWTDGVDPAVPLTSYQTYEESKSGLTVSAILNGSVIDSKDIPHAGASATNPYLGCRRSGQALTGTPCFTRILVYDAPLSASNASLVRAYLAV